MATHNPLSTTGPTPGRALTIPMRVQSDKSPLMDAAQQTALPVTGQCHGTHAQEGDLGSAPGSVDSLPVTIFPRWTGSASCHPRIRRRSRRRGRGRPPARQVQSDKPRAQVARNLGISESCLARHCRSPTSTTLDVIACRAERQPPRDGEPRAAPAHQVARAGETNPAPSPRPTLPAMSTAGLVASGRLVSIPYAHTLGLH